MSFAPRSLLQYPEKLPDCDACGDESVNDRSGVNAVQHTACLAVVAHGGWSTAHTLVCTRAQHLLWTDSLLSLAQDVDCLSELEWTVWAVLASLSVKL